MQTHFLEFHNLTLEALAKLMNDRFLALFVTFDILRKPPTTSSMWDCDKNRRSQKMLENRLIQSFASTSLECLILDIKELS